MNNTKTQTGENKDLKNYKITALKYTTQQKKKKKKQKQNH